MINGSDIASSLRRPERLQFFLELYTNGKSDHEIVEFLKGHKDYFKRIESQELLFNYFYKVKNYTQLCLLIEKEDRFQQYGSLINIESFAIFSVAQRERLRKIIQEIIEADEFGSCILKTDVLPKIDTVSGSATPSLTEPALKPTTGEPGLLVSMFMDVGPEMTAAQASALLHKMASSIGMKDSEWTLLLNATTDQHLWTLVQLIIEAIPSTQIHTALDIFLNQIAYGLCHLPSIELPDSENIYPLLKLRVKSAPDFWFELSERFIDAENLRKLLDTHVIPIEAQEVFRSRLYSIEQMVQKVTLHPPEPEPQSEHLKMYGTGVSQELFRTIQSNMVRDVASKLPSPEMASSFDFNAFIERIFKGRCALVSKANPSELINWDKRYPEKPLLSTPISERYFPYYRKALSAILLQSNKDYLNMAEAEQAVIMYKQGDYNIPLTSYGLDYQWNHTHLDQVPALLGILEKQYQSLLSVSSLPENEDDFRMRFLPKIAESHWLLSHTCPFNRGSAFVAETVTRSFCLRFGFECSFGAWMPDCEALVTPNVEVFKTVFAEKAMVHDIKSTLTHSVDLSTPTPAVKAKPPQEATDVDAGPPSTSADIPDKDTTQFFRKRTRLTPCEKDDDPKPTLKSELSSHSP